MITKILSRVNPPTVNMKVVFFTFSRLKEYKSILKEEIKEIIIGNSKANGQVCNTMILILPKKIKYNMAVDIYLNTILVEVKMDGSNRNKLKFLDFIFDKKSF